MQYLNQFSKGINGTILRVRIPLFLVLLMGTFLTIGLGWYSATHNQLQSYTSRSLKDREIFVQKVVELEAESLGHYVYDISYWDDLIRFVKDPKPDWAKDNLTSSIEGYRLNAMWVLRRNGQPVMAEYAPNTKHIALSFSPTSATPGRDHVTHWYAIVGDTLWEFHATTIHHSSDVAHKGPFFGYFVVGRELGPDYIRGLETRLQGKITLPRRPSGSSPEQENQQVTILPLRNQQNQTVAFLRSEITPELMTLFHSSLDNALAIFIAFTLLASLALGYLLFTWIGRPLRVLSGALQTRNQEKLCALLDEKTEFGDLAWLMHQFFEQEKILREAHDELEQRVIERTEALAHQAYHDGLTGLPNRVLFRKRLDAVLETPLPEGKRSALFFMDLDNFKLINDSLGHEAGDQALCLTAQRLSQEIRAHDIVARLGGDEFAILLIDTTPEQVVQIAQRLQDAFLTPLQIADKTLFVTLSMGIAIQTPLDTAADLLRHGDTAMYHAKANGKGGIALFDQSMKQDADRRLELEAALRNTLQETPEEFSVAYQPIFDLVQGKTQEVEALVRWNHPTRGFISPAEFIPIAEDAGLIGQIGTRVLTQASRAVAEWSQTLGTPLILNVNISVRQLQAPEIVEQILGVLQETGLPPQQLVLEVTESVMLQYPELTAERLVQLRATGIQIAIDDFGTGYSSLSSLAQLPIDTLKIDRSFVAQLDKNREALAIIQAIIELALALQLRVVAEGIETKSQWDRLQVLGTQFGQGYYYARPLTPEAMRAFLTTHSATRLPRAA